MTSQTKRTNCGNAVVLVHGGAGDVHDLRVDCKLDGVKEAALEGYKVLIKEQNSLDAVEAAIHSMEDNEEFNAVARLIMEKTPHCFLGGEGLEKFIVEMGVPRVPEDYLIIEAALNELENFKIRGGQPDVTVVGNSRGGGGTVGCVVVSEEGHVASGTSTGGLTGKLSGRIGDSPLSGCGGYCDDEVGAVSTTGHGESIMKYLMAYKIINFMERGESAQNATVLACEGITQRLDKTAGAITVSNKGDVGIFFTTTRMPWAYQMGNELHFGIDPGQHCIEIVE